MAETQSSWMSNHNNLLLSFCFSVNRFKYSRLHLSLQIFGWIIINRYDLTECKGSKKGGKGVGSLKESENRKFFPVFVWIQAGQYDPISSRFMSVRIWSGLDNVVDRHVRACIIHIDPDQSWPGIYSHNYGLPPPALLPICHLGSHILTDNLGRDRGIFTHSKLRPVIEWYTD